MATDRERPLRAEQPEPDWGDWASARRRKLTLGLRVSPAERLHWLEQALRMAAQSGALARLRRRRAARGG